MKNLSAISITVNPGPDELMLKWFDSIYYIDKSLNLNLFTSALNINQQHKNFAVLPIYEAKYYSGIVFVWDLLSLELCLDFPNIQQIFYYQTQQIPWINNRHIPYNAWAKIFDNDQVSVIVDDMTVQEILSLTWKQPTLIKDMSPETLYEILR